MGFYSNDRRWSDRFIEPIKQIVGPHLVVATPNEIDCKQAADLMVFTARDVRIAARVRRHGYATRYRYEFTVRAKRDTGSETELSKIINGWGDWMFYGHADESEGYFELWWLIDLHAFRAALIRDSMNRKSMNGNSIKHQDQMNGDGTYFKAFDLRSFPPIPPILIAGSVALPISQSRNPVPLLPFEEFSSCCGAAPTPSMPEELQRCPDCKESCDFV